MKKNLFILIVLAIPIFSSCKKDESEIVSSEQIQRKLDELSINQGFVKVKIGGKLFYQGAEQFFDVRVGVNPIFMKGSLLNATDGNMQFDFGESDWYKKKPFSFKIVTGNDTEISTDYGSILIGKLSKTKGIGEGYQLVHGLINVLSFNKDKVVITIDGKVLSPGMAQLPENMKSIKGYIIIKQPAIDTEGLDLENLYYE